MARLLTIDNLKEKYHSAVRLTRRIQLSRVELLVCTVLSIIAYTEMGS